jgi:RNA polymerase sigma-70 factor, ECF subfamily
VDDQQWLVSRFEERRPRLAAVAYRMLGSRSDAHDAVQETWLRLNRSDATQVDNLSAWLTTVVARVCLDMLRKRASHPEEPRGVHLPDPVVEPWSQAGPEQQAVLADSVGLALLVVLDTLTPDERLAFVLHDMFAVPFDRIAELLQRSPAAAKMLASRARRRVQGTPVPDSDLARQREVVDAFFAAARDGDFEALVGVLDPDVVLRGDGGTARPNVSTLLRGARTVAGQALTFARLAPSVRPALVNRTAGAVIVHNGRAVSVMSFTVARGRIAAVEVFADPDRLHLVTTDFTRDGGQTSSRRLPNGSTTS